jgi:endonuclease III
VIRALREFYGLQPTPPADLFQFFVWEILSEDSLPARRDLAWQALKRIPALTPDAVFRAPARDLLEAVGLAGPYREEKVERIRATVGEFKRQREQLSGESLKRTGVLRAARLLRSFAHLDDDVRRRAHLFAIGASVLPVDDQVSRVINRLRGEPEPFVAAVSQRTTREKIWFRRRARRWLADRLSPDVNVYRDAIVYLRHHAAHTCLAVAPHCTVCPLNRECLSVEGRDTTP